MNDRILPNLVYRLRQGEFGAIPGSPWVYWVSKEIRNRFKFEGLEKILNPIHGTATYDNFRFLRFWWEADQRNIFYRCNSWKEFTNYSYKYVLYMKGGSLRRWYGNQQYLLLLAQQGKPFLSYLESKRDKIRGAEVVFHEGITWSDLSSKGFGVRYLPPGFIFDVQGSSGFPENELLYPIMAVMNSPWMRYALKLLNATLHHQVGDIARIPFCSPSDAQKDVFDALVPQCIHLQQSKAMRAENTFDFTAPPSWQTGVLQSQTAQKRLADLETRINDKVYALYEISEEDHAAIEVEIAGGSQAVEEEEESVKTEDAEEPATAVAITKKDLALAWFSYAVGIVLSRFQPGVPGELGCTIYRRANFAIGSLSEPNEEEFNDLVGDPSKFAYIDEQAGRHVFSCQVEQALQALALPDGITVFDPNHLRDLPTMVSKALRLMLGEQAAAEVIAMLDEGRKTNNARPSSLVLRQFLEKDFFTQHHIKQYRKRPVYWPIQSAKRSYGFVLFHEKIDRNTFYALQQEPYLPTKRRAVQLRLEELNKKVLSAQGANRKPIEKEMDELRQLAEELAQFARDLEAITRGGYEPEADWIDDGVILRMAPLWSVIPLWKNQPKKYWEELAAGKYDWSRIAKRYWPDRVKEACKKNKSFAIAHGHEEWYQGK